MTSIPIIPRHNITEIDSRQGVKVVYSYLVEDLTEKVGWGQLMRGKCYFRPSDLMNAVHFCLNKILSLSIVSE